MSNHAKPFDFHQTDGSSNLSFRERLVLWCKKYLRELEAGIHVYPHQTSNGKTTATALRYHLLSQSVCEAAVTFGANTDFGPAIRHSEGNPRAIRDLPTQEHARTRLYLDLYADFFWKAYLSIKQPLTAHGPIHPQVSSRHDSAFSPWHGQLH